MDALGGFLSIGGFIVIIVFYAILFSNIGRGEHR